MFNSHLKGTKACSERLVSDINIFPPTSSNAGLLSGIALLLLTPMSSLLTQRLLASFDIKMLTTYHVYVMF